MSSVWETKFIVIDVETTGSRPVENRITDIACVTLCGGEIISEYSSLVNPHQFIPDFIARMTGITNAMVYGAPEAAEVMPKVKELLSQENAVFVAHNAAFDWSFIKETFLREGIEPPDMPRLCSLKLARRLLAGNIKKGVAGLSDYFKVKIIGRHRALGDAIATANILTELLEIAEQEHEITDASEIISLQNKSIKNFNPPSSTFKRIEPKLNELPDEPGVYYFIDRYGGILYVGKAKSLKERVRSYFYNNSLKSRKILELIKKIHDIRWRLCNSELAALILESREIKKIQPPYNSAELRYKRFPFIKLTLDDEFPRLEISHSIEQDTAEYYGPFRSSYLAEEVIRLIDSKYKLRSCEKHLKPSESNSPCFDYHIKKCLAPCIGNISVEEYKTEVAKVREFLSGNAEGVIDKMENRMYILSDNLNFEEAALLRNQINELKKLFSRSSKVPTSVDKNNLIIINPASSREKLLNIMLIKSGRLIFQEIIGRKAPLTKFNRIIHEHYFNGYIPPLFYTDEDIDELRIVSSWLYRQQNSGVFLYLDGKPESAFMEEFESSVRNFEF